MVYGDADRIRQVADNLLTNAIKFTRNGTVCFRVSHKDVVMTMEVEDSGIGMDKETIERIFRPFERAAPDISPEGFGLGLPITKGLVNLLGGSISVSSHVGEGSLFHTEIPLAISTEPVKNHVMPTVKRLSLPKRIILVDDDPIQLRIVMEMLERNGTNCTTCATTKEVVKAMRGKDYDLLLSDIQMPGTNGFELLTLLRNSNIGNSRMIPVIAMTARGDRDKEAFHNAGFTDCIYKPFSSSELLSLLSMVKSYQDEEKQNIDFSMILSEVSDKSKTLLSFISQSEKDREELATAMKNGDRQKLREITHRMQPMWELLQMEEALSAYRVLLKNDTISDNILNEHTRQIMDYTAILIKVAEAEIKRVTNETEDTDS